MSVLQLRKRVKLICSSLVQIENKKMVDGVERRYLTTAQLLAQPFKPRKNVDMSQEAVQKS